MARIFSDYVQKAKQILETNRAGDHTRPAPGLYPHQWNWDSGFIAIGKSHYDTKGAEAELTSLLSAQWQSGMVPQIVFDPDHLGHYFPEPDFWQTEESLQVPAGKLTSGITMPPILALAAEKIYRHSRRPNDVIPFLKKVYPRLLALHEYLYRERDFHDEGLVYIRHPWESGIDNSPTWDGPLKRINIDRSQLPQYRRRDTEHVSPEMRPSDDDYDRYVYLVDLFRKNKYDEKLIAETCPFLIQDPLFNSILCRSNLSLVKIAEVIGEPPEVPRSWAEKTSAAIRDKLWCEEQEIFNAYDLVRDELIYVDTAAGFMPLFGGAASQEQAEVLYRRLDSASFCSLHQGNCYTIPNYDTQAEAFDSSNYWRGPVWININWMLSHGLRQYGYTLKADSLQKDLLQLPIRFGFHEYFDSFDGSGYGSDNFSWTAALFIDLVMDHYQEDKAPGSVWRRIKSITAPVRILNEGEDLPECSINELAEELMAGVRNLSKSFYDTGRGMVDYERLRDSSQFRNYRALTNGLVKFDPGAIENRNERLAFWINLYNTIVIDGIVTLGVKSSAREVPEFFTGLKYNIGGNLFSADDIEHGILRGNTPPSFRFAKPFSLKDPRKKFTISPPDPRIHFALVCGSRSCPPIKYYDPSHIDQQLDQAARSFINSSEVMVLPEEGKVLLSEIFRWYEADFGGKKGVLDFICSFLVDDFAREFIEKSRDRLRMDYLFYDWNLNVWSR